MKFLGTLYVTSRLTSRQSHKVDLPIQVLCMKKCVTGAKTDCQSKVILFLLRTFQTLEKGMATHSSILAWIIPWTEEPGGLQSMGSQRVRHDWSDWAQHSTEISSTHAVPLIFLDSQRKHVPAHLAAVCAAACDPHRGASGSDRSCETLHVLFFCCGHSGNHVLRSWSHKIGSPSLPWKEDASEDPIHLQQSSCEGKVS